MDGGQHVADGHGGAREETPGRAEIPDEAGDPFAPIAGAACLDFINTVGGLRGDQMVERLSDYADLLRWSQRAGVLSSDQTSRLMDTARQSPDEAEAVLRRAVALREALYRVVMAFLADSAPAPTDLAALNAELAHALAHMALAFGPEGFVWQWLEAWTADEHSLDAMLWRVARSAADLLLSPAVQSVRQCAGETCGWLFIDTTKNRSRRWCDMRGCGNRAKVRRHRARKRADHEQERAP